MMTRLALVRNGRLQALLVALIALLLRLAFDARLAPYPFPDSSAYLAAGKDLLQSGRMSSNIRMPLYPLLLAWVGDNHIILVQAVLSAATALIVYYLSREIFRSNIAASLAGLLAACDPVEAFYANQRLSETLFTFLLALSLLLFYRRKCLAGSVVFILSLLTRPTFDLLAIPLIVVFIWINESALSIRRAAGRIAIYLAAYVILMSPWWWHNYEKYGRFVRLDLGDGIIVRLEQSPQFAKYGFDWPKLIPITSAMDNVKDPVRRDALLRHAAIDYIRAHPLRYVKLCIFRFGRFWSPVIDQDENFVPEKPRAAAFAMTVLLYVLCLLTLASIRAPALRKLFPLLLVIAYLTAIHTLLHALPRYRVPIEPLLCVLASGAALRVPRKLLVTPKLRRQRERPYCSSFSEPPSLKKL